HPAVLAGTETGVPRVAVHLRAQHFGNVGGAVGAVVDHHEVAHSRERGDPLDAVLDGVAAGVGDDDDVEAAGHDRTVRRTRRVCQRYLTTARLWCSPL